MTGVRVFASTAEDYRIVGVIGDVCVMLHKSGSVYREPLAGLLFMRIVERTEPTVLRIDLESLQRPPYIRALTYYAGCLREKREKHAVRRGRAQRADRDHNTGMWRWRLDDAHSKAIAVELNSSGVQVAQHAEDGLKRVQP
ncbi:hypothetical protein NM688_g9404 [Phlebia brevispora]|uniref:Uncharacterized protein n=1 Tax=Phlebia brevispora TaxID=194682 RepID=A0ACC1RK93_9APHY|nr:hypothetical protein NM688_g9404 [Phlebia brevispora]